VVYMDDGYNHHEWVTYTSAHKHFYEQQTYNHLISHQHMGRSSCFLNLGESSLCCIFHPFGVAWFVYLRGSEDAPACGGRLTACYQNYLETCCAMYLLLNHQTVKKRTL
jgi:hypothetical protein